MPVSRCHDYLPTYLFLPRAEIASSEKGTHRTRIQRTSVTVTLMGIGKSVTVADCHCPMFSVYAVYEGTFWDEETVTVSDFHCDRSH